MLEFKNLCSGYGKKQVLFDVCGAFERGKITAVIGVNGCGKSTLLRSASNVLTPFSGEVLIDGEPIRFMSRAECAKLIAYLSQQRDIPDMSVFQLVLHGRCPYLGYLKRYTETDKRAALEAMEKMGIADLYDEPLCSLSGGMRQKAYIAMALAQDTDYILFDEPTTYLDISHQLEFMEIIKSLTDIGKGVITVMHDLPLAFNFSDRIIVMNEGRVVADSFPQELQSSGIINEVFGVYLTKTVDTKMYVLDYHKGIQC